MASFAAKHLSVFLFLVLFTSLEIQARESKFFSKFSHYNVEEPKVSSTEAPTPGPGPTPGPTPGPAPAPAPEAALAPAPTYFESENGYDKRDEFNRLIYIFQHFPSCVDSNSPLIG